MWENETCRLQCFQSENFENVVDEIHSTAKEDTKYFSVALAGDFVFRAYQLSRKCPLE